MSTAEVSPLTTQVLNSSDGVPGARMALSLHRLDSELVIWTMLSVGTTDEAGRCPGLIRREAFTPGMYKLRFETASYWESRSQASFYPYVEVGQSSSFFFCIIPNSLERFLFCCNIP
uniref:Transthyretin n=1 Tax=Oryzias latipes TaxID=8090 RepID=A0A3P9K4B6_ORYLA